MVDRSIEAKNRDIVIAILEGNLTVKRLLFKTNGLVVLKSENIAYKDIQIPPTKNKSARHGAGARCNLQADQGEIGV